MLERERQVMILSQLKQKGFITVKELVKVLDASEATIRRDLGLLAKENLVLRIHGGAELAPLNLPSQSLHVPPKLAEPPLEYRKVQMLAQKKAIAAAAAKLIGDEETIMIDGGSTTFWMAEFLTSHHAQVITNSFAIAAHLLRHSQNTVICAGGVVYPSSEIILNPFENNIFKHYRATKVFLGVRGIDERGATNSEPVLIQTEREMIKQGKELIVLADSSKFESAGPLLLCGFDKIHTVITDSGLSEASRIMVERNHVRLIIV